MRFINNYNDLEAYPSVPGNVKILVLREAPPKEVSFNGNNGDDDWGFC